MKASLRELAVAATVAVAAGGVAFTLPGSLPSAAAEGFVGGSASARAEAVRVQIDSVGAPGTDRPVEFGFPSSSAGVSGLQGSAAQASLAYPGEIVLNGPGLCQVVVPQCRAPDYPFIVESNYGTKNEAKVQYGLTALEAASQQWTSKGSAVSAQGDPNSGGGQNASISTGTIDPETGVAKADAATVTDTFSFGDTLKIGSVRSTASVTQEPGQELVRSSSLEVKGVTIAGQAVGITESGLVVGSDPTPLPAENPLEQALAQAGIKLRWLRGYDTTEGVVAPALEIVAQGQMPGLPAPSVLTIRLGYATAAVQAGQASAGPFDLNFPASSPATGAPAEPPPSDPGAADTVPSEPLPPAGEAIRPADGPIRVSNDVVPPVSIGGQPLEVAAAAPGAPGDGGSSIGSSEAAAPSTATGEAQLRAGNSREMAIRRAAAVLGSAPSDSGRTLYLQLAAGALLALLAVLVFRLLAKRLGGQS